jgi:hypothetical protein
LFVRLRAVPADGSAQEVAVAPTPTVGSGEVASLVFVASSRF